MSRERAGLENQYPLEGQSPYSTESTQTDEQRETPTVADGS